MPWEAYSGLLSVGGTWLSEDELPVALHGDTAHVATTDRLLVFDTTNQLTKATIRPEGGEAISTLTPNERNQAAPPVVTEGASPLVLAPFLVSKAGVGTQAARGAAELVAADAVTGKVAWRLSLALPGWTKDVSDPLTISVVGTSGNVAVVTLAHRNSVVANASTTYAINLTDRRVLWSQDTFTAATIAGGVVVGEKRKTPSDDYGTPTGYVLTTGAQRWQGQEYLNLGLHPAGPNLVYMYARAKDDYRTTYLRFLDARTGEVRQNDAPRASKCRYDGASAVVCFGREPVVGVDASTGAILWQLPDEKADRVAPKVTAVWHGRVYGKTANGTVALDSRTGADLPTPPGIAPDLVNAFTGVAISASGDDVTAYQSAN
ncbi:PQQ-binding-like beta-propeller repeat protein [Streptomyces sp. NPDC051000]|uniref:outer membrane protein assembly factor BamB family protein n=1 Tax=Streptomyces sp. NPDC051000 TaxID=3155520 RepID=UPI0033E54520